MTHLSDIFSFTVLLQCFAAAVLIAFFCGMLGIYFRKEEPLEDNVILIEKEMKDAA